MSPLPNYMTHKFTYLGVDSHEVPTVIRLRTKQSKTDLFRAGVDIFLGSSGAAICPVQALLQYISVRSAEQGPLFIFQAGNPLIRALLVKHMQEAIYSLWLLL